MNKLKSACCFIEQIKYIVYSLKLLLKGGWTLVWLIVELYGGGGVKCATVLSFADYWVKEAGFLFSFSFSLFAKRWTLNVAFRHFRMSGVWKLIENWLLITIWRNVTVVKMWYIFHKSINWLSFHLHIFWLFFKWNSGYSCKHILKFLSPQWVSLCWSFNLIHAAIDWVSAGHPSPTLEELSQAQAIFSGSRDCYKKPR